MPSPKISPEHRNYVEVALPRTAVVVQSLISMLTWTGGGSVILFGIALIVMLMQEEGLLADSWQWLDNQWLALTLGWGLAGAIFAGCAAPTLGMWLNFLTHKGLSNFRGDGVPLHSQRHRARTRYQTVQGAAVVITIIGGLLFVLLLITTILVAHDDEAPPALWLVTAAMLGIGVLGSALYRRMQPHVDTAKATEDSFLSDSEAVVLAEAVRRRIKDQQEQRHEGGAPYQRAERRYHQFSRRSAQVTAATLLAMFVLIGIHTLARARCRGCDVRTFDEPLESAVRAIAAVNAALVAASLVALLVTGVGIAVLGRPFHQAVREVARSREAPRWRPEDQLLAELVAGPSLPAISAIMTIGGTVSVGVGLTAMLLPSPIQLWGGPLLAIGAVLIVCVFGLQVHGHQRRFADRALYRAVWPVPDPLPTRKPGAESDVEPAD